MTMETNDAPQPAAGYRLAHASMSVYGDQIDPDFWTSYFGCSPDKTRIKSVKFITPAGRFSKFGASIGIWAVSSREAVLSDHLTPHIEYLVSRLLLPRGDLPTLLELRGELPPRATSIFGDDWSWADYRGRAHLRLVPRNAHVASEILGQRRLVMFHR